MLTQFGPQTVNDMKIRQLLQSLSPEMRANSDNKLPTTSGFAEFLESSNAKKVFSFSGTIFYLNHEVSHKTLQDIGAVMQDFYPFSAYAHFTLIAECRYETRRRRTGRKG